VTLEFFFSGSANGEVDTTCTISSPSDGSISGTTITGVTADGSLQTVFWDTTTDGATSGTTRTVVGKII
jgi:hypothetical protein